jgi:hypothetical protein
MRECVDCGDEQAEERCDQCGVALCEECHHDRLGVCEGCEYLEDD